MNRRLPQVRSAKVRSKSRSTHRVSSARVRLEVLEAREMLSINDLLISTYDDTYGRSVLRYSNPTHLVAPGGAATSGTLAQAQGLAVAPDGSYYVSSGGTASVQHYSNSGQLLAPLGAGDGTAAPLALPGALAFGPDGKLYVADLFSQSIFVFDTANIGQQYQAGSSLLGLNYSPGGIAFSVDAAHDLVVGAIDHQAVYRYHNGVIVDAPVSPGSGIFAASILPQANGDYLIADLNYDFNPNTHHQIVRTHFNGMQWVTSTFINFTAPSGPAPQPSSMIFDTPTSFLVGLSPDHNLTGTVQRYDLSSGAPLGTIVSGIGTPTGLGLINPVPVDLLAGVYDSTDGKSVLRYNDPTYQAVPGTVPTSGTVDQIAGVAVAPDGSFYVASTASASVFHYAVNGTLLGSLGQSDTVQAPLMLPGTLVFGPNYHLYVGDLAQQKIFEFDTTSLTQQYLAANTMSLGYSPGGITFTRDASHDIVVGAIDHQAVYRYHNGVIVDAPISPGSGIFAASILAEENGDFLVADLNYDFNPTTHHKVWRTHFNGTQWVQTVLIDFTFPADVPNQPTGLLFDHDGNILVGMAPDHSGTGSIRKYNVADGSPMGIVTTGIGTPAGLAFVPSVTSVVAKQLVFYNNSKFDGNGTNGGPISAADDAAIATDKTPLLSGGTATFANLTSYDKGLNGVMIDLSGKHAATLSASDFTFHVGNNNSPDSWVTAPAPAAISIRSGAGDKGTDRVEIVWADGAIKNNWLQVIVKANANTGLPQLDGFPAGDGNIFYFGNKVGNAPIGDNASFAIVGSSDELDARNHQGPALVTSNIYDYNRDKVVNSTDQLIARNNTGNLRYIVLAVAVAPEIAAAPLASLGGDAGTGSGDAGLASGLATASAGKAAIVQPIPAWFAYRLGSEGSSSSVLSSSSTPASVASSAANSKSLVDSKSADLEIDEAELDGILGELGLS